MGRATFKLALYTYNSFSVTYYNQYIKIEIIDKILKKSRVVYHQVLIIRTVFSGEVNVDREERFYSRHLSRCLTFFPRENVRVRDVPAICVFWRVSGSSEPDVSTPETREAQPAVSGFGFPRHPPPLRVLFRTHRYKCK